MKNILKLCLLLIIISCDTADDAKQVENENLELANAPRCIQNHAADIGNLVFLPETILNDLPEQGNEVAYIDKITTPTGEDFYEINGFQSHTRVIWDSNCDTLCSLAGIAAGQGCDPAFVEGSTRERIFELAYEDL